MKRNIQKEREANVLVQTIIKGLSSRSNDLPNFLLKKKLKGCTAWTDFENISLSIFSELVPSIIHEMIHFTHFHWSETRVTKAERLVKHYIKIKDVIKILSLFLNCLNR